MEFNFSQEPGQTLVNHPIVKTDSPLISVITPFYNGAQYFEQTFRCVENQTFPWFEWIIINDGSTHLEDWALVERLTKVDPRIKLVSRVNAGPGATRNFGIREAAAEYICPLDCDDLIEPTYLEYCWWMLERNPAAAWSFTEGLGFGTQQYLWKHRYDPEIMKSDNQLSVTALIRKSWLTLVDGYDTTIAKHYNEDWHMWLRLIAKGAWPVQSTGEPLFWYRRHDQGELTIARNKQPIAKLNKQIIQEAASSIHAPKQGLIHPQPLQYCFDKPNCSTWKSGVVPKKAKYHLLMILPWLVMGGADKFNLDLVRYLPKENYEVSILTTVSHENTWLQEFRKYTPNVFNLPNFVAPRDYAEFVSYYIKSRQPDVLFVSNSYHGYYMIPWLREQFPNLVIVDYVHMEEWYWRNGGYARTSGAVGGVCEKTYVCNSATRDVMIDHFGRSPESVETVHIGVDEKQFDRNQIAPGACYQETGIVQNRPIVLFICRLHPQKRPFLMLRIAQAVKLEIPDVAFVVVGDGGQEDELRRSVAARGLSNTVFFLGAKKDVCAYYRDAKITLICSLKEGLSLTAYESCAMGVPVVSADVGGQKDLVDDSVGALITCRQTEKADFDKRDFSLEEISDYSAAIVKILSDDSLWTDLSAQCRKKIENGFTIDAMVHYFDVEFDRLAKDNALRQARDRCAAALHDLSPLAEDYCTMEFQLQAMEDDLEYFAGRNRSIELQNGKYVSGTIKGNVRQCLQLTKQMLRHTKQILRLGKRKIKRLFSRIV